MLTSGIAKNLKLGFPKSCLPNPVLSPLQFRAFFVVAMLLQTSHQGAYEELLPSDIETFFHLVPQQVFEESDVVPTLQMGKRRLRAVHQHAQDLQAGRL